MFDAKSESAMVKASRKGDIQEMRRLLTAGVSADAINKQRITALAAAAAGGQVESVQILLGAGANVYAGFPDNTALVHAVRGSFGNSNIIKMLMDAEVKGGGGTSGGVALMLAIGGYHTEATKILLDGGFIPEESVFSGVSMDNVASIEGHIDVALVLLQKKPMPKGAHRYIAEVAFNLIDVRDFVGEKILEDFLNKGLNPNTVGPNGNTLLMEAARLGSVPLVEILLRRGARPDALDMDGETALDKIGNYLQIADILNKAIQR